MSIQRALLVIVLAFSFLALTMSTFRNVEAAKFTSRSVTISSPVVSATVTNVFQFNIPSSSSVGSIEFEYCENNPFVGTACTPPTGFSAASAVLSGQTGETGFSIHGSSTANRIVLTRSPSVTTPGAVSYTFSSLTNPSTPGQTVYVRLATFATDDGTGSRTDEGAVAFITEGAFTAQGFVPPYLRFCVGITVALDCSSSSGNYIDLGNLSSNQAKTGTSQTSSL